MGMVQEREYSRKLSASPPAPPPLPPPPPPQPAPPRLALGPTGNQLDWLTLPLAEEEERK